MPPTINWLPLSVTLAVLRLPISPLTFNVSPLLACKLPWLVKVLGLTVIVPPAICPQLIACTTVLPESTSMPLTNG